MSVCYHCGNLLKDDFVGRKDECSYCGREVHVCRNCLFYDVSWAHQCRERVEETIVDKEKSNFCDFFRLGKKSSSQNTTKENLVKNFNDLFR